MTKTLAMMPMVKSLIPLRDDFKVAATAACIFPTPAHFDLLKLHTWTLIRLAPSSAERKSRISDNEEALMDPEKFDEAAWHHRGPEVEHVQ